MKTYGPYQPVRIINNLKYTSGQIGIDPEDGNAPVGIEDQTRLALKNLQHVLNETPLSNVIKTTVFLRDMNDFEKMNSIYMEYFAVMPRPARSCVGVSDLPHIGDVPLLIEIEAIAFIEEDGNE